MKAVSSHEVLAESFYQVRREKLSFSGKPSDPVGILKRLGCAARELDASSVLLLSIQKISDEMEPDALHVLYGLVMRYLRTTSVAVFSN